MCHGPLRFCNYLHVLKVDPYHVEQPLKQFWSCLNDWNLFSIVGQRLLKNAIYDLWKSASPEAFYSPLFAVVHYFFDRVYLKIPLKGNHIFKFNTLIIDISCFLKSEIWEPICRKHCSGSLHALKHIQQWIIGYSNYRYFILLWFDRDNDRN